ncbi:Succinate dehydrogenase [ubiquinone] cytochrome b small subunit, mitochondrial [Nakaseomyces bracarensis]|uniref:Succinate dehydrogenase [ubiquinone] cytochrome b small subunit n=1 Tax=Nakaseomyces bracarensis TaxID=273131 RepID=A0ABR4NN21_9SACH
MFRFNIVGISRLNRSLISTQRLRLRLYSQTVDIPKVIPKVDIKDEVKKSEGSNELNKTDEKKDTVEKKDADDKSPVVVGKDGIVRYRVIQPSEPENSFQNDYHKYVNYTLVPLTLVTYGSVVYTGVVHPLLDTTLSTLFLVSTHYHFTSCILDFIPKEKFKKLHKLALYLLYSATGFGLFGIYEMETEGNGFVDLLRRLWSEDDSQLFFRK